MWGPNPTGTVPFEEELEMPEQHLSACTQSEDAGGDCLQAKGGRFPWKTPLLTP